jgi:hypothetical protein
MNYLTEEHIIYLYTSQEIVSNLINLAETGLSLSNLPSLASLVLVTILSAKRAFREAGRRARRPRPKTNPNVGPKEAPSDSKSKPKDGASETKEKPKHTSHTNHNVDWAKITGYVSGASTISYLGGKAINEKYELDLEGIKIKPTGDTSQQKKPTNNSCSIL